MVIIVGVYWPSLIRHTNIETSYQNKCPKQRTHTHTHTPFYLNSCLVFILFAAAASAAAALTVLSCLVLSCILYFFAVQPIRFNFVFFSLLSFALSPLGLSLVQFIKSDGFDSVLLRLHIAHFSMEWQRVIHEINTEKIPKHTHTHSPHYIMYARNKR